MSQIIINTGNVANDGLGTPLRNAFNQVNYNFTQLFNVGPVSSNIVIANNSITATNTNGNLNLATNGIGSIVPKANFIPDIPNVRMLGAGTNRFNTVYAQYINANTGIFSGNVYVSGNLLVTGNVVTVDYSTISVANSNITLATGAANASQANGGGLLIPIADANFTYNYSANSWNSTIAITAPTFIGDGANLTNVIANVQANALLGNTFSNSINYSNLTSFGQISALSITGSVSTTGNVYANAIVGNRVTANYLYGNGSNITNITANAIVGNVPFALVANTAYIANLAALATQAINADTALFAINANLASWANTATIAQTANAATYAVQADNANSAVVAGMAYQLSPTADLSITGNITTGGYFIGDGGLISNIVVTTSYGNSNVSSYLQNLTTNVSTTGNITADGNITGGNILTGEQVIANGEIQSGTGLFTGGYLSVNGSSDLANVNVSGNLSAVGNINAATFSASGNILSNSLIATGVVYAGIDGQLTTSNSMTFADVGGEMTLTVDYFSTSTVFTNDILGDGNNINVSAQYGNSVLFDTTGGVSAIGNITGNYILGDGSQLTNLPGAAPNYIVNGNSYANIASTDGNLEISADGNTWNFATNGNLTLPGNSEISINYANGDPYGGYPSGNSGAVQINWLGTFSNQGGTPGDTYSTLQFDSNGMPTLDGTTAYQQRVDYSPYLQVLAPRVESTDFGIVAGPGVTVVGYDDTYNTPRSAYLSVQDQATATQQWDFGILGNGSNNYSISDRTSGNVWTFATDGSLTLPGGLVIGNSDDRLTLNDNFSIGAYSNTTRLQPTQTDATVEIATLATGNMDPNIWTFDATGGTVFPTLTTQRGDNPSGTISGQTLLFGDATQEAIISTPDGVAGINGDSSQRLVINPGEGYQGGEGGDIYLWAGRGGNASGSGGDIKIRGGQGGANTVGGAGGAGGYIRMEAGDAASTGGYPGYIDITGGYSNTVGGYVNVTGGQGATVGGDVKIYGGYGTATGGNVNIWGGASGNGQVNEGHVNIETGGNTWTFDSLGNLTLPSNTSSINYANGDPYGGGGGANTGNVTFSDQIVIGTGISNLVSGLYLAPSSSSANAVQYLRVRGDVTYEPTHIHFDTGNNQYFNQFIGDDNKYVLLSNIGNIVVRTDDYVGNSAQWTFGANGNLTIPGNIVGGGNILIAPDSANSGGYLDIYLTTGPDVHVASNGDSNLILGRDDYANVTVNENGNVSIQASTGSSPSVWTFDTSGNLTAPGAISATGNVTGGNLVTSGSGGNITLTGGNITGVNNISTGTVTLVNGAVIRDTANNAVAFGNAAGLTSQGAKAVAIGLEAGEINQGFISIAIGAGAGGNGQGQAAVAIGTDTGNNIQGIEAIAIGFKAANQNQGQQSIAIGKKAGYNNQGNNSIILNATGDALDQTTANTFTVAPVRNDNSNVAEVMFYNTASKEITYGNTISVSGNITAANFFGNGSTLSNVATTFESTWTVPTGNSTQSFTVNSGTYSMWVDCNIPNGILVWNATATVTNTNVPVVGAQYAWVYNGGGTPIDFTSIPNQFVGTANAIVRSNTAPSATTNRFDFGINNTSGNSQTVRYGWAQIS
jgi:hypothetical protein